MDERAKAAGALPKRWITVGGVYVCEQLVASGKLARRQGQGFLSQWPK